MIVTENFSITGDEKKIDELKKYISKLGLEVKVNDEIEDADLIENAENWRKVAKDIKAIKEGKIKPAQVFTNADDMIKALNEESI